MKLIEIFEPEWKNVKLKAPNGVTKNTNLDRIEQNKSLIGSGHFSNVFNHKDEHMVKKMSNSTDSAEGDQYWTYVDRLITTKIWEENPFFPRIYSIKRYELENRQLYKGIMEKLIPASSIEKDILDDYLKSLMNSQDLNSAIDAYEYFNRNKNVVNAFGMIVEDIINGRKSIDIITNDALAEAIDWLRANRDMGSLDIHGDNIMFRRGKTGIQLVFADPIAFG